MLPLFDGVRELAVKGSYSGFVCETINAKWVVFRAVQEWYELMLDGGCQNVFPIDVKGHLNRDFRKELSPKKCAIFRLLSFPVANSPTFSRFRLTFLNVLFLVENCSAKIVSIEAADTHT